MYKLQSDQTLDDLYKKCKKTNCTIKKKNGFWIFFGVKILTTIS